MSDKNKIISLQEQKSNHLSLEEKTEEIRQERIKKYLEQKATNSSDILFISRKKENTNIMSQN